ncbi:YL1-domain-containing protein [Xylona heveae TC161]|uniref:YL1-domain-containing protein n=1 Tax=Xylona heveae (strain CBS 132557 / TC161) TaxID=1328760 RepID=A0A165FX26_XYLHT|nr:YL1-domain-containing protein [Xylona heveae TC161]KZF21488.1 YL1-domain-containing protein [Xylona heveae TC161]
MLAHVHPRRHNRPQATTTAARHQHHSMDKEESEGLTPRGDDEKQERLYSSSPSSGSDNEAEDVAIESLVAGRAKRSTAGNRLSSLLDHEVDDEYELLFAEDEEDVEFEGEGDEEASDVQLESSSEDDEDQGPVGGEDDDFEGEKELQREARAERLASKRKAKEAFLKPPALRKHPRVDRAPGAEDQLSTPAPRPKKKSERVSWIPAPDEGPTRSSSRKLTMQNKEVIHARMKETEKRRLQQLAVMEAAARRRETQKPKAMTQADRLAEAEKTEKLNSKSLNRWEEMEKKRAEEQKARLAALQNRHLEGPVITWWSGPARWVDGKLAQFGKKIRIHYPEDPNSKPQPTTGPTPSIPPVTTPTPSAEASRENPHSAPEQQSPNSEAKSILNPTDKDAQNTEPMIEVSPTESREGIHTAVSVPESSHQQGFHSVLQQDPERSMSSATLVCPDATIPATKQDPPVVEHSARNLVILENFDPLAVRERELQRRVLLKQKRTLGKLQKPVHELCVITSQPAKYRDPASGLPYLNSYAYRKIQKLQGGSCQWSSLLGCYVGQTGVAARGVPERFASTTNAGAPPPTESKVG